MKEISLIDVHAHLEEVNNLSEALIDARESGIKGVIAVGMDLDSNKRALEIAEANWEYVYPALGYHPWKIALSDVDGVFSFVRDHIRECVALGEIGLDYKVKVKKELQWKVFGELLDIARQYDKPVITHSRFSYGKTFEMVASRKLKKAVFHWYAGPLDLLKKILDKGYFISATPALSYSPYHQEAIRKVPLDRILLETDTPVSYQGKESRPRDVWISLNEVARLKGIDPTTVAEQTTANASSFFQLSFQTKKKEGYND